MEAYIKDVLNINYDDKEVTQINFSGCNFNCPWCYTPDLLFRKEEFLVDLKDIKQSILQLTSYTKCVIFSGGEPTLQRAALIELSLFCKENNIEVILHTNGSKPECIEYLLKNDLITNFILDFKSPLDENYFYKITKSSTFFINTTQIINDFKKTLILFENYLEKINVKIITTIIPSLLFRKEDLVKIGKQINDNWIWKLQKFEKGNTLSKSYIDLNEPGDLFMQNLKEFLEKEFYLKTILIDEN
ncbi:MAG: radical SAM protein [Candidatus Woesearchaeota archaeon]